MAAMRTASATSKHAIETPPFTDFASAQGRFRRYSLTRPPAGGGGRGLVEAHVHRGDVSINGRRHTGEAA
jgi:hypothetical protein